MQLGKLAVAALAAPALIAAMATPSQAAPGAVAFVGTTNITPTASGPNHVDICWGTGTPCTSNGGVVLGASAEPGVATGMSASVDYGNGCFVGGPALIGSADIDATLYGPVGGLAHFDTTWDRFGLVALIGVVRGGDAVGAAVFAPDEVPACGRSVRVTIIGAVVTPE